MGTANASTETGTAKPLVEGFFSYAGLWLFPLALFGIFLITFPFGIKIAEKTIPISGLTTHQKLNIQKAVDKIDGTVLRPGEEFSFNKIVGPRTEQKGFYSAPSYVGSGSYSTPGGGICVISSALYQDALSSGLKISQRVPHQRTMQTVEPGLDATVWYGGADLKFVNNTSAPIQVRCNTYGDYLTTTLAGSVRAMQHKLTRRETSSVNNQLAVEVFQDNGVEPTRLISRDLYVLHSPRHRINSVNQRANILRVLKTESVRKLLKPLTLFLVYRTERHPVSF